MSNSTAVALAAPRTQALSVFADEASFESALRLVKPLVQSNLVPVAYQGVEKTGNALIALDMANRMGLSPIIVMQNLHVIEGRPSWSSKFIIGALASCGLFSPIRWKIRDLGEVVAEKVEWSGQKGARTKSVVKFKIQDKEFIATAIEKATGEILEGPPVTFSMAIAEGWYHRPGSKWLTMPDLMGRYRSASMFGGLYAPHITNGMPTQEEVYDMAPDEYEVVETSATTQQLPADGKPAARPKGVHAAINKGKAKKEDKPAEAQAGDTTLSGGPAEGTEELDADRLGDDNADGEQQGDVSGSGDMFDAPGDEDYDPA
jgi:hypothetical protein